MNDIIQAMETRRSIRQFKPDMPRKEELQQIIEAGLYAANGRGRQGAIILAVLFWLCLYCLSKGMNDPFMYFRF